MIRRFPSVFAAAALLCLSFAIPAAAQTISGSIAVGANPMAIAVNPGTNKVYVANYDANSVTVIDGRDNTTRQVAVGTRPSWIAVNPENGKVYVANVTTGNTSVIDGTTDTVRATLPNGVSGPMAIHPWANRIYQLRIGSPDEVNILSDESFIHATAMLTYTPVGLAINPRTDRLYVSTLATSDIVALNMTGDPIYAPRECPDGNGGLRPYDPADHNPPSCIDIPGRALAVVVNPLTNKVYGLSDSGQISVILAPNNSFTALMPPGGPYPGAKTLAVNPISNKVYAIFGNKVVVMDGATNAMQVLDSGSAAGGPVAIGINVITNKVYVPNSDGTLTVIDGDTNAVATLGIPAGAKAIAVNPVTNKVYILGSSVTVVDGSSADTIHAVPLSATITPLPNNAGASSGSITVNAASAMSPSPLNVVRGIHYQIDGGAWTRIGGAGPFTIGYAGLAPGSHTLRVFAANGLDAPNLNTDLAHVPIVGNVATYTFTVGAAQGGTVTLSSSANPSAYGQGISLTAAVTGGAGTPTGTMAFRTGGFTIAGCGAVPLSGGSATCSTSALTSGSHSITAEYSGDSNHGAGVSAPLTQTVGGGTTAATLPRFDFNGDANADILWQHTDGSTAQWLMDGSAQIGGARLIGAGTGWTAKFVADFSGEGSADILWQHADGRTALWLMNGASQVGGAALIGAGTGWNPVLVADFNGDGRADIVWLHADGRSAMWIMNGATQVGGAALLGAGTGWSPKLAGEFNRDGKSDLVWVHADGRSAIWLMNGATQAGGAALMGAGTHAPKLARDLNGDGVSDLVFEHGDGSITGWLMSATSPATPMQSGTISPAGAGIVATHAGDLNGDGKMDLVVRRADGATLLWLMNGLTRVAEVTLTAAGSGRSVKRVADFDGDGKADVLTADGSGAVRMHVVTPTGIVTTDILAGGTGWTALGLAE